VLAAIRNDELYVFTHPETREAVQERFRSILAAFDKAAAPLVYKEPAATPMSATIPTRRRVGLSPPTWIKPQLAKLVERHLTAPIGCTRSSWTGIGCTPGSMPRECKS